MANFTCHIIEHRAKFDKKLPVIVTGKPNFSTSRRQSFAWHWPATDEVCMDWYKSLSISS